MRISKLTMMLAGGIVLVTTAAFAQTPTGGTTLAGGNNGANAKMSSTMGSDRSTAKSGSPSAMAGHGSSTEHSNGKMRGSKEF